MNTRQQEMNVGGLGRLAGWCYDHRRSVVIGWIVIVVAVIGLSSAIGSAFSDNFASGNSASQRAQNLLAQRFPAQAGDSADVVIHTSGSVKDPANAATIDRLVAALRPLPNVSGVRSPLAPGAGEQVSADGHTAFAVVQFDKTTPNLKTDAHQAPDQCGPELRPSRVPGGARRGSDLDARCPPTPAPVKASGSRPPSSSC